MTPTERSMIESLFERIRSTPMPSRDAEAERLIESEMARTPGAAYALAQTVLVQDQALKLAADEARILKEAAKEHAPAEPAGSLLSRVGLGGVRPGAVPRTGRQAIPEEEGRAAAPSSGGFLAGALQTAAGVAGGALLFEGVKSLLGGSASSASSGSSGQESRESSADKDEDRDEDRLREASYEEDDAEDRNDDDDDDWSDGGFDGDDSA